MPQPSLTVWLNPDHYSNVLGALALLVILSLVLERGLALVFEWGVWSDWLKKKSLRAPLAFIAAYAICATSQFDILAIFFAKPDGWVSSLSFGTFLTAAVIAGGSKGAILLFQGILGFGQEAVQARVNQAAQKAKGDDG